MSETRDLRPVLVRGMRQESTGVLSVELEPLDGEAIDWEPGAHLDVRLPDGTARQYSLSGAAATGAGVRIAVLHEPAGRGGSDWVHARLRVGDTVEITAPRNHFALEPAAEHLFIAGGIGITPILPMIAELQRRGAPWRLAYAGRSRTSMAFLGELARYPDRVTLVPADEGGRLDIRALVATLPAGALVYVCGPQRLLDAVDQELVTLDRADTLRRELFAAPAGDERAVSGESFTVELRRSGISVSVPPEQSVLEAVTAAGVHVLTDCEEGICGSCETTVLGGEPEHRDYVLTTQEKARNDCMMICVSRSSCPVLVLDL
jgi:ferredoxin-NADP reductase